MDYNILIADFAGKNRICMTDTLYQYDYGQKLKVENVPALPQTFEAHFSNVQHGGVSITITGMDGIVDIPNTLLMTGKRIYCWIYVTEPGSGETEYQILLPVQARPMPEYYDVTDVGVFDSVVQQVGDYAATATAGATSATASAAAAATSASEAAASASAAETAKTAAQTAQGKAEDAQTAAETAAQGAADSAFAAGQSATAAGQSATQAAQSATAAAQSAASIEGDVQTATQKAAEATAAADQAVAAKNAAQTAQTAAETAATNAGQSASTATAKAAEAAQSASGAAQSKTDAEAAATRAEQAAASLTIDSALSDTSVNPVQNKVITGEVTQLKSALSQAESNAKDGVYSLPASVFTNAALNDDGTLDSTKKYYATTSDWITLDYPTRISVVDPSVYQARVRAQRADGTIIGWSGNSGTAANGTVIAAGMPFKVQIYKTGVFAAANLDIFARQVTFSTKAWYQDASTEKNTELMQSSGAQLLDIYVTRGTLQSGNYLAYVGYRAATMYINQFDRDVTISADTGFRFAVHTFDDADAFVADLSWKTSYTIAAGQKFRLIIARKTDNTSELIDIWEFYSAIHIQSPLKDYIDIRTESEDAALLSRPFLQSGKAKLAAHTGYHVTYPENSVPAFREAGKRGYWGIESDVQQTSDGYYVMCHDTTVDRTTDGTGNIANMTLAEIRALTLTGSDDLKIPTLEEYLTVCKRYGCVPIIEIKGTVTNTAESYQKIIAIVKQYALDDSCIFIGSKYALANFKAASERIPFMPVYQTGFAYDWETEFAFVSGYDNVGIDWQMASGLSIDNARTMHNADMIYGTFTVDNTDDVESAFASGVDFVTTNTVLPTD